MDGRNLRRTSSLELSYRFFELDQKRAVQTETELQVAFLQTCLNARPRRSNLCVAWQGYGSVLHWQYPGHTRSPDQLITDSACVEVDEYLEYLEDFVLP